MITDSLEHIAYVRFALQLTSAGFLLICLSLWAIPFCDWLKSDRK